MHNPQFGPYSYWATWKILEMNAMDNSSPAYKAGRRSQQQWSDYNAICRALFIEEALGWKIDRSHTIPGVNKEGVLSENGKNRKSNFWQRLQFWKSK